MSAPPRSAAAALLAALALQLTACGGGGGGGALSKPDYVTRGNEICAKFNEQRAKLPQPAGASPAQLADYLGPTIETVAAEAKELRALPVPAGDEAAARGFLDGLDEQVRQGRAAVARLRAGDVRGAQAAVQPASRTALSKAFDDYGLTTCGTGSA